MPRRTQPGKLLAPGVELRPVTVAAIAHYPTDVIRKSGERGYSIIIRFSEFELDGVCFAMAQPKSPDNNEEICLGFLDGCRPRSVPCTYFVIS